MPPSGQIHSRWARPWPHAGGHLAPFSRVHVSNNVLQGSYPANRLQIRMQASPTRSRPLKPVRAGNATCQVLAWALARQVMLARRLHGPCQGTLLSPTHSRHAHALAAGQAGQVAAGGDEAAGRGRG